MTYFLILRLQDNRFIRKGSTDPHKRYVTLYGTDEDFESIWVPDIYLINEIPNGILDFNPTDSVRMYENGTLRMSKRYVLYTFNLIKLECLTLKAPPPYTNKLERDSKLVSTI